jgi:hypothetical protein
VEVWPNAGAKEGACCPKAEAALLATPKGDVGPNPDPEVGLNALGLPKAEFVETELAGPNAD